MGEPNVNAMLRRMTSAQWLQWKAWLEASVRHLEAERADWRMAMVAAAVWNVQIAKGNGAAAARGAAQSPMRQVHEFLAKWGDMDDPRPVSRRQSKEADKAFWADLKMLADSMKRSE